MIRARTTAGVAAAVVAVLCLSACTGDTTTSSTTSASISGAAQTSANAVPSGTTATSAPTGAQGPVAGLDPSALEVMNKAPYAAGQWAIAVRDMDTGEQIISLNEGALVEPGSVVKTYSMGAGWQQFGPDHKIVTPVKRTGEVVDGTLNGNLVLVGKGDLTMGGRTKPDGTVDFTDLDHNDANALPGATLTPEDPMTGLDQLAAQVKAAGITTVSGEVIVDDRLWKPHHLENGPVSPIIINQNLIDFTTTPTQPGQPATTVMSPKVAPWTVDVQVQTVAAGGQTQIQVASPEAGKVVLSGTIAADSKSVVNVYAFDDPATFARTAFIEALQRAGVTVTSDPVATNPAASLPATTAVDGLPSVAELESLSLDQEATYTLKISYNRGAETMICLLAVEAGSTDCSYGLPKAAEIWKAAGLDTTGAALIDGSGLTGNLITPINEVDESGTNRGRLRGLLLPVGGVVEVGVPAPVVVGEGVVEYPGADLE
jgi:serine-type D-Ala-D-Ala carboxypeptidase/endopeptidase (penicillin-binding protein 4)